MGMTVLELAIAWAFWAAAQMIVQYAWSDNLRDSVGKLENELDTYRNNVENQTSLRTEKLNERIGELETEIMLIKIQPYIDEFKQINNYPYCRYREGYLYFYENKDTPLAFCIEKISLHSLEEALHLRKKIHSKLSDKNIPIKKSTKGK